MTTVLFIAGLVAIIVGVALVYTPLGVILGGVTLSALAVAYERGGRTQPRRNLEPATPEGDS